MATKTKKRIWRLKEKIEMQDWFNKRNHSVRNVAMKFEIGRMRAAIIVKKED